MSKLESLVCVKNECINKDILNIMCLVVGDPRYFEYSLKDYRSDFIGYGEEFGALQNLSTPHIYDEPFKEISLSDWCFSGAPEGCTEIVKFEEKYYYIINYEYFIGVGLLPLDSDPLGYRQVHVDDYETIIKKENPDEKEEGEELEVGVTIDVEDLVEGVRYLVTFKDDSNPTKEEVTVWSNNKFALTLNFKEGSIETYTKGDFPTDAVFYPYNEEPKYTEEELLCYELYKDFSSNQSLTLAGLTDIIREGGAAGYTKAIRAGWRKVG